MTGNKKSVVLHGGTGNQLFQWAYGHYLKTQGFEVSYTFFLKNYLVAHANFSIQEIVPACIHGVFEDRSLPKNRILKVLLDPTHSRNPFKRSRYVTSSSIEKPFDLPQINQARYQLGYFQNWEMVYDLASTLELEILSNLNNGGITEYERQIKGSQVIHVRQGDTMHEKNRKSVGVLSKEYYDSLPIDRSMPVIAVTDDLEGARHVLRDLKVDEIFGPEQMDVAATLRTMSNASYLFTANSTLGWWGGFLASRKGAEVFIPAPFFRNVTPNPGDAFDYPTFKKINSKFLE